MKRGLYALIAVCASLFLLVLAYIVSIYSSSRKLRNRLRGMQPAPAQSAETAEVKKRRSMLPSGLVGSVNDALYAAGITADSYRLTALWLLGLGASVIVLSVLKPGTPVSMAVVCAVCAFPTVFIFVRKKRRVRRFEEQLADAIDILCSAMRAGHSFQGALQTVCRGSADPAGEEFEIVFNEIQYGISPDEALANLAGRMKSRDVDIFCTAVRVQNSIGGNLIEVLRNIASTIRARIKVRKEIKSKTAAGRLSGIIIGVLPAGLYLALTVLSPDYLNGFLRSVYGKPLLLGGAVMMLIGFLCIARIVDIRY